MWVSIVEVHGPFWSCTRKLHAWSFHAELLHCDHHCADELVAALETKKLVLPVRLVEENNIEGDGIGFVDRSKFSEDVLLVFPVLGGDKFQEAVP